LSNKDRHITNVPLHVFFKKQASNPHGYVGKPSKTRVFGGELSNPGAQGERASNQTVVLRNMLRGIPRVIPQPALAFRLFFG
jgi:hypothetical protein